MPSLVDINAEEAEKKLSLFRRYPYEVAIFVLTVVVTYLFVGQKTLERDMRNYLIIDRTAATDVIRQNTDVMKQVIDVLLDNKESLRTLKDYNYERGVRK